MQSARNNLVGQLLAFAAVLLILKVTVSVVAGYRDYFPPNFRSDFLLGRESYFFGLYQWAFYTHIAVGPATLLIGLVLVGDWFRTHYPKWHRSLGKLQGMLVLMLLCPSGLWMAQYAQTGAVAGVGLSLLAVATAVCVLLGWRAAVQRRFVDHRRWMLRCFLLLCSAVVLRVIGGFVAVTGIGTDWAYPFATWVSWLGPLAVFEVWDVTKRRPQGDVRVHRVFHHEVVTQRSPGSLRACRGAHPGTAIQTTAEPQRGSTECATPLGL
jgi:hypothetical protein